MQRLPVESSDIVSIGYEPRTKLLEVEFQGGRIYQYQEVEPQVYQQFMHAESYGQYFNTFINLKYRYRRIAADNKVEAPRALAFVTGNSRKVRDLGLVCEPLGILIEQLDLPVDEIQSEDAAEVATKKARQAYKLARRPVLVNDVFWNIIALRGFPGAYMKEVAGWLRTEDFLKLMEGKTDRTIGCTDTLVYHDGKRTKVFTHTLWGKITEEPRGGREPSIDKIVVIEGQTQTIAELEEAEARSSFDLAASNLQEFAKWFNMQRRIGRG